MEDMEKIRRLYQNMSYINENIKVLESNIGILKNNLEASFVVDGEIIYRDNIEHKKNRVNNLKNSVRKDILNNLERYL